MPRPVTKPESIPRNAVRLGVAMVLSLAVHLAVLVITDGAGGRSGGFKKLPATPPQSSTIRLGISESTAETLTWLGFLTPTPHEAIQSEIEQAAFVLASASGGVSLEVSTPSSTPMGSVEQSNSPASLSRQERSPEFLADADAKVPAYEAELGPMDPPLTTESLIVEMPEAAPSETDNTDQNESDGSGVEGQADAEQTQADAPTRDGVASEKESPATSPTRPLRVEPGKPAAAQGLEIQTRVPPELTIPTRLLAGSRRAVFALSFSADGSVRTVSLSRSSGNVDLDRAGLNAMYSWTAKGKPLENLDGEKTITVYIELVPPL